MRAWIGRRGLAQKDICERTGITPSSLSRKLKAKQPFNIDELDRAVIAVVLGLSLVVAAVIVYSAAVAR